MALVKLKPTIGGRLGFQAGRRGHIRGWDARVTREFIIDLATSAYVTGGWPIHPGDIGGMIPVEMYQVASPTMMGKVLTPIGYQLYFDNTDERAPLLKAYYNGSEVSNGATADGSIGVMFIGRQ